MIAFCNVYEMPLVVTVGTDNPVGPTPTWPHHPQPLPLALLSQSEGRMDSGLVTSLHRTSSIQGLLGQHLSSSQLSFSSSVVMAPLPGPGSFLDGGHKGSGRAGLGHGLPYEGLYGKWSMSGRKGFNGPAAAESDGGASQFIRTQVRTVKQCNILKVEQTLSVQNMTR